MTSAHLIQWIEHPETLDKDSLYELRTLLARYPYFQTLRLLYLKNLYLLHDTTFGEELRKSVLYVADRRQLFYQIEGNRYQLHPHQPSTVVGHEVGETGVDRTLYLIDSFLSAVPDEQLQSTELDYAMDYTTYLLAQREGTEPAASASVAETPLLRGHDLIDNFLSKVDEPMLSLEDEIGASAVTASVERAMCNSEQIVPNQDVLVEIGMSESSANVLSVPETGESSLPIQTSASAETVEKGLPLEAVALGEKSVNPVETCDEESFDDEGGENEEFLSEDETFTETLAKIYIKQHRYDKALEIIKKLSLNYPKKNAYFADQIRFLEKLIINAKSK